mgnify:CR=1 FL=1
MPEGTLTFYNLRLPLTPQSHKNSITLIDTNFTRVMQLWFEKKQED